MLHRFGPFELDERRFELRRRGSAITVQRRVLETIVFLVRNPDRLVSKDELIDGPWRGTSVSDAALARVVMMARRALGDASSSTTYIETVRGKGYRFVGQVVTLSPSERGVSKTKRVRSDARLHSASKLPFFGRKRELERMHVAAAAASAGQGTLVLIGGEPGIGKTSLLERFADGVRDMNVLWGRCWEGGGAPALWPWIEVMRGLVEHLGDRAAAMFDTEAFHIAPWIPELRRKGSAPSGPPLDRDSAQTRFRTFEAVSLLLHRAAVTHPIAIVIDDLHDADEASVLLLQFVCRSLRKSHLLLVGTYRALESRHRPALSSLLGAPGPHTLPIALGGLTEQDTAKLLGRTVNRVLTPALARRIFKATSGNPFLVGELGRAASTSGSGPYNEGSPVEPLGIPDHIAGIVRGHLKHLPDRTIRALSIASVIGREFALPQLADLCRRDPNGCMRALEPALLDGIIKESASGARRYSFSHALTREALYQELAPSRRLALHFATAQALERRPASNHAGAFPIAHHYFSGAAYKGAEKAVEWAVKAASAARDLFAYELAAEHLENALRSLELSGRNERKTCEILLLLADAQRLAGLDREALATLQRAESTAQSNALTSLVAQALLGCMEVMRDGAGIDQTLSPRMEDALSKLPQGDHPLRARLLAATSFAGILQKSPSERLALCDQAIPMARRLGDPKTLAMVLHSTAFAIIGSRPTQTLELMSEMIEAARICNHHERVMDAHLWRAARLLELGRLNEARTEMNEHARLAKQIRHPVHIWWVELAACVRALASGDLELAENMARRAHGVGLPLQGHEVIADGMYGAQMFVLSNEWEGSRRRAGFEEVMRVARKFLQVVPGYQIWSLGLAAACFELDAPEEGRSILTRFAANGLDRLPEDGTRTSLLFLLSKLAVDLNDTALARVVYGYLKSFAGAHLLLGLVAAYGGPANQHLGRLALILGDTAGARTHFENAIRDSRTMGSPHWKAWAECELGLILCQRGKAADSARGRELLQTSVASARRLGLSKLETTAKKGLREMA